MLIVEDDFFSVQIASFLLQKIGYSVEIAKNGKEGVEKYKNGNFDYVLMDIQLPVMNGLEAIKKIREINKKTDRTAIIVSTSSIDTYLSKSEQTNIGADFFIQKPFIAKDFETIFRFDK